MITNITDIKNLFKTGKKPSQGNFGAIFDSFWHKHEGILIKHPTETEISQDLGYLEAIALSGNIRLQKFGTTQFVGLGKFVIHKAPKNSNPDNSNLLELGDVGCGFLEDGTFIPFGKYLGPDPTILVSWDTSPMWKPDNF